MTDLSPAAEAVLNAVTLNRYDVPYYACLKSIGQIKSDVAAALRGVADQVAPEQTEPPCGESEPWPQSYQLMADSKWEQRQQIRAELLAIAAELEGAND